MSTGIAWRRPLRYGRGWDEQEYEYHGSLVSFMV